jgi:hypothetical protein
MRDRRAIKSLMSNEADDAACSSITVMCWPPANPSVECPESERPMTRLIEKMKFWFCHQAARQSRHLLLTSTGAASMNAASIRCATIILVCRF